jgi:hypothetical protein
MVFGMPPEVFIWRLATFSNCGFISIAQAVDVVGTCVSEQ